MIKIGADQFPDYSASECVESLLMPFNNIAALNAGRSTSAAL